MSALNFGEKASRRAVLPSSLLHDRQAAEDDEEQFFGIIRLA